MRHNGRNLLAFTLILVVAFIFWQRVQGLDDKNPSVSSGGQAGQEPFRSTAVSGDAAASLLPTFVTPANLENGITRRAELNTIIPGRPRDTVITYTVQAGDNLFSIGDKYGLKPETILWGNYETLKDNPEVLQIDQVLNILPVDGVYYQWKLGDNLESVAASFTVEPENVLFYPGNQLDLTASLTSTTAIASETWLIIPGGKRPLKDWGPPAISRSNPAAARYYGPGSCGEIYEGAVGTGAFVWPTTSHIISGYNYSAIHRAIDIGGALGNAIYAADSGVVVYAGWSNYGYGNLLVIDHGNGWQTAYAHMNSIGVGCGQSVGRGTMVGGLGSTGNSTGPHLHFEMQINGVKVNPLDYVQ